MQLQLTHAWAGSAWLISELRSKPVYALWVFRMFSALTSRLANQPMTAPAERNKMKLIRFILLLLSVDIQLWVGLNVGFIKPTSYGQSVVQTFVVSVTVV